MRIRLILAITVGLVVWSAAPWQIAGTTRALLAWDATGLVLLGFAGFTIARSDAHETRRRAAAYDPGRRVVWIIVLIASTLSLLAASIVVGHGPQNTRLLHDALCVATVVISWLLTHSVFALRYARLYYRDAERRGGGIELPGDESPDGLDFAYFAFTIAMCFQVSDAAISSRLIRRTALGHAMLAFLYNTVIFALALNLIVDDID